MNTNGLGLAALSGAEKEEDKLAWVAALSGAEKEEDKLEACPTWDDYGQASETGEP